MNEKTLNETNETRDIAKDIAAGENAKHAVTWKHFDGRTRNVNGVPTKDRGFSFFSIGEREYIDKYYAGKVADDLDVAAFCLGIGHCAFLYHAGDNFVVINGNNGARANEYVDFFINNTPAICRELCMTVHDLPTGEKVRNGGAAINSFNDLLMRAAKRVNTKAIAPSI